MVTMVSVIWRDVTDALSTFTIGKEASPIRSVGRPGRPWPPESALACTQLASSSKFSAMAQMLYRGEAPSRIESTKHSDSCLSPFGPTKTT